VFNTFRSIFIPTLVLLSMSFSVMAKDDADKTDVAIADLRAAVAELQTTVITQQDAIDAQQDTIDAQQDTIVTLQTELETHVGNVAGHHTRYEDTEAVSAVGAHSTDYSWLLDGLDRVKDDFGKDTLLISGMNVQIVNGTGHTDGIPADADAVGTGNLIIGYNGLRGDSGCPDGLYCNRRDGSHNLVIGDYNNYSFYGGMVVGLYNEINGGYSSVSGGLDNTASGFLSSVSGGVNNTASGRYSSVSGGRDNRASEYSSSVSGGRSNTASGYTSSVSGGNSNTASGDYSSVSGGLYNAASRYYSSVSGGNSNTASGNYSSVSGGRDNTASGRYSSVSGGYLRKTGITIPANDYDWVAGTLFEDE